MTARRSRRAFTLMEMVVTIVVAAIVSSVGLVAVGQVISRFDKSKAEATANEVILAERTFAGSYDGYASHRDDLTNLSRSVTVVGPDVASTGSRTASLAVGEAGTLAVAVAHKSGCLRYRVNPLAGGGSSTPVGVAGATPCTAASALAAGENAVTPLRLSS